MFEVVKELVEGYLSVAVPIELHAHLEEVFHLLSRVQGGQLKHEVSDLHCLGVLVSDVLENIENGLASRGDDILKDLLQEGD